MIGNTQWMNQENCKVIYLYNQPESCKSSCVYLVDPASSHTLVLKIKPCMSTLFDDFT